jgi:hypothetical protein
MKHLEMSDMAQFFLTISAFSESVRKDIKTKLLELNKVKQGERHNTILTEFNRIIWDNFADKAIEDIHAIRLKESEKCDPPLPVDEIEQISKDAVSYINQEIQNDRRPKEKEVCTR